MRHSIVVFTKVPQDGKSKSRLSDLAGGPLTVAQAREFYEASLLDTIDAAIASRVGDVYLCVNETGNLKYLAELLQDLEEPTAIRDIFIDEGASFDQGMDLAVRAIFRQGGDRLADSAIVVGGDMPAIQPYHFTVTAAKLERLAQVTDDPTAIGPALVESPCQEAGSNLIAYTYTTPFTFGGVFYNREYITTLDMIVNKAVEERIPFDAVEMITDVDLPIDLTAEIPRLKALAYAAKFDDNLRKPRRTIDFLQHAGLLN